MKFRNPTLDVYTKRADSFLVKLDKEKFKNKNITGIKKVQKLTDSKLFIFQKKKKKLISSNDFFESAETQSEGGGLVRVE